MKYTISIAFFAYCILSTGCVYMGHRTRDFSDIVTLAAETRNISCDLRLICPMGISFAKGKGFGLREGYMGKYEYKESVFVTPVGGLFELDFTPENDYRKKGYLIRSRYPDEEFWSQCLSVQVSIGLYYGARAGLNVNEAVDFLLGWTTLDIMGDDRSANTNTVNLTTSPRKN
jgi:hypothetical protein